MILIDRAALSVAVAIGLVGCGKSQLGSSSPDDLRLKIQAIADRCSPHRKIKFELRNTNELQVRPDRGVDYREVDCFLTGIKPFRLNLDFIGNEVSK
jgi:hypothetical protein